MLQHTPFGPLLPQMRSLSSICPTPLEWLPFRPRMVDLGKTTIWSYPASSWKILVLGNYTCTSPLITCIFFFRYTTRQLHLHLLVILTNLKAMAWGHGSLFWGGLLTRHLHWESGLRFLVGRRDQYRREVVSTRQQRSVGSVGISNKIVFLEDDESSIIIKLGVFNKLGVIINLGVVNLEFGGFYSCKFWSL